MEMRFVTRIVRLGRITVPKTIRDFLGLREGDLVEVVVRPLRPRGEAEPSSRPDVGAEEAE